MPRYYAVFTAMVLTIGSVSMLNLTRASDDDKPISALDAQDESSQVAKLVERIDQLEKRLAALEGREPLIRQADSREPADSDRSGGQQPAQPKFLDDDGRSGQNTNGQKWQIHLLNNRQTSPRQTFENLEQNPKLAVPRNKQKPTT